MLKPFNVNKGLRKLKQKQNLGLYIKYGTFAVSLLLFVATVIFLTRATYTSRHDFELINAKVGEFTLNVDIALHTDGGEINTYVIHGRRKTPIGTLPEPVKTGYVFTGWYSTPTFVDGSGVNSQTVVTRSITDLYAHYEKGSFELQLDLDGGELEADTSYQVEFQDTFELPEPTKVGYTFNGWEIVKGDDTSILEVEENDSIKYLLTMGYKNSIVKAKWIINSYILTFIKDPDKPNDKQIMQTEYNSTVPIMDPSKTGYTFTGWTNIEKLVDGRMPAEDVTLTANYTVNNYKWLVNHNIMNGDGTGYDFVEAETGDGAYGTKFRGTLKNYPGFNNPPQRERTILEDVQPGEAGNPTNNVLDYDYIRKSNTLTISPNGGEYAGSTDPTIMQGVYYQQQVTLGNAQKIGYDFNNWTISGTASSVSGNIVTMGYDSATVTANWIAKEFSVTFNVNGGNVLDPSSKTVIYDDSYGELPEPTRIGYIFSGWYTEVNDGEKIVSSTAVKILDNQTLYAHWTPKTYTVTLSTTCGSGATVTATYDQSMPSKNTSGNNLSVPTCVGYTFGGYYTSTGGSGTQYYTSSMTSSRAWNIDSNTTLYAKWTANTRTVTLDKQGGSGGTSSVVATYGQAMPSASAPGRVGYTFGGYYTSTGGSGTQYYTSSMASTRNWDYDSNKTLYAKWTVNSYSVAINVNNASSGSSSISITYGGSNRVVITPKYGYYLSSATCTSGYTASATTGENATGAQTITITNKSGNTGYAGGGTCTFTAVCPDCFSDYLLSLADSNSVIHQDETANKNMRFIGANPNNYVLFQTANNEKELFRVIGVFDSNSHGKTDKLVKIIQAVTPSIYKQRGLFDSAGTNNFATSSSKQYLNDYPRYYNYIFNDYYDSPLVQEVTWKTGAITYTGSGDEWYAFKALNIYNGERSNTVSPTTGYSTTVTTKIAFPYLSDFLYSTSGSNSKTRLQCLEYQLNSKNQNSYWGAQFNGDPYDCTANSWLYTENSLLYQYTGDLNSIYHMWTLDAVTYSTNNLLYAARATNGAMGMDTSKSSNGGLVPSFYLKSNVRCTNCNDTSAGTADNPWILDYDYKYWDTTSSSYSTSTAPATLYTNYSDLVSISTSKAFVRTTYDNGSVVNHEPCLYYNSNMLCFHHDYWEIATGSKGFSSSSSSKAKNVLQNVMESTFVGENIQCTINSSSVECDIYQGDSVSSYVTISPNGVQTRDSDRHYCLIDYAYNTYCR